MKKIPLLLLVITLFSCGNPSKKEKEGSFERKRSSQATEEKTDSSQTSASSIEDIGIGPIKSLTFDSEINTELAEKGKKLFNIYCSACHKPDFKLLGPALKGVYTKRNPAWVMNLLLNTDEMLEKDPAAKALLKEYNGVKMLNQDLSEEQAREIVEYLRTFK